MLILGEKINGVNVLHIVIGPETFMQFNLNGHSTIDISEYIANYEHGEKCMLSINKCDSEEEVINMLEYQKSKSQLMSMMNQVSKKINEEMGNVPKKKESESNKQIAKLKCPLCLNGIATIKDGMVLPCETCQKIEDGLKSKKIPPVPSSETLDQIRKKVEEENQQQKKSIFKFYKKEENKNKKRGKENGNSSDIRPDTDR